MAQSDSMQGHPTPLSLQQLVEWITTTTVIRQIDKRMDMSARALWDTGRELARRAEPAVQILGYTLMLDALSSAGGAVAERAHTLRAALVCSTNLPTPTGPAGRKPSPS